VKLKNDFVLSVSAACALCEEVKKKTTSPRLILILNPNRNPGSLNADFLNALSCKRSDTQNAEPEKNENCSSKKGRWPFAVSVNLSTTNTFNLY